MSGPLPILVQRRRWRDFTLFALYFAQGVPEGLLYIAVPAWLASNGASGAEIGAFIGIILLPWSFKLVNGVLMDRFQYPAMGRRRPWIIGAQLVLVAALVALSVQAPQAGDLFWLSLSGFVINMAAAFQDVAIDGMAIDIVPEEQRGRANGLMWGGKTLGIAGSSIVCGALIADYGFAAAVLAPAVMIFAILLLPLSLRERPGERLLPWSAGAADAATPAAPGLVAIVRTLIGVMLKPANLVLASGIFVAFSAYGLKTALVAVFAVQDLGWDQQDFTRLAGGADLLGGLFGMAASGWIADRLGHGRAVMLSLLLLAGLHAGMALAAPFWPQTWVFAAYFVAHALLFVLLSVSVYARAMAACEPLVAATQFAAFMAMLNLGTSFGAQQLGALQRFGGSAGVFSAAAGLCVAAMLLFAVSSAQASRQSMR
jgi:PAT family beta-lactamase induction signal transducer AmpG